MPQEIHHYKLTQLSTRHELPLSAFLRGFFVKPTQVCDQIISEITVYSESEILTALKALHPRSKNSFDATASYLHELLSMIKQHENFICHVGNRLYATGLGDMNVVMRELMNSDL